MEVGFSNKNLKTCSISFQIQWWAEAERASGRLLMKVWRTLVKMLTNGEMTTPLHSGEICKTVPCIEKRKIWPIKVVDLAEEISKQKVESVSLF